MACGLVLGAALLAGQARAADDAKTLFMANCMQCHQTRGIDNAGNIGPVLADMKQRFPDRDTIEAIIYDEPKRNPRTVMPPFGRNLILTKQEIDTVIDFLYAR
jgi:sulfur-oxidizing protein SoxX